MVRVGSETSSEIKILLVGKRYTGKGQIGRLWGQTRADMPALQPVLLYDRKVPLEARGKTRVVAWVLSFDPEFADLRHCFYPGADGVMFTFDLLDDDATSLAVLDEYIAELEKHLGSLPPHVLVGTKLHDDGIALDVRSKVDAWRARHGNLPYYEVNVYKPAVGVTDVEAAFLDLLDRVTK